MDNPAMTLDKSPDETNAGVPNGTSVGYGSIPMPAQSMQCAQPAWPAQLHQFPVNHMAALQSLYVYTSTLPAMGLPPPPGPTLPLPVLLQHLQVWMLHAASVQQQAALLARPRVLVQLPQGPLPEQLPSRRNRVHKGAASKDGTRLDRLRARRPGPSNGRP